ncbi:50S ribosomal protein L29 [Candidatus Saccharibacteria bacterium]|nr:50S ribosomal protein L29 [Candidatus Saccharibacteria bacterium]
MKAKELRNKSNKELQKDLQELQAGLATAAVDYRTKEIKNVKQIHNIKKDIARVLTILHQQEMEKTNE